MTHPTCGTCTHWTKVEGWDIPPGFQRCLAAAQAWHMTEYDFDTDEARMKPGNEGVMICGQDGSSYRADVLTRGDFYCPMHSDLTKTGMGVQE